jgi:uncharacterized protein with GYD domain
MSEERFARIEHRLDDLNSEMHAMGAELRSEMHAMGAELRSEMHAMGAELRSEMQAMGAELRSELQAMGAELGHQMRVLHEHLVDQISALSPDYHLIDRRIEASKGDLRDELLRRIEPLEAAERSRRRSDR